MAATCVRNVRQAFINVWDPSRAAAGLLGEERCPILADNKPDGRRLL